MLKQICFLLMLTGWANFVQAQDEHDALRYSYLTPQGTARSIGLGSAVGSMGADFGVLNVNPAGLGLYKSSEMMISPYFSGTRNESVYLGSTASNGDFKFNLGNFGLVIANTKPGRSRNRRPKDWRAVNFAFGMNRLATFRNEYTYSGVNRQSSFIETYADDFNSLGGITNQALNQVNFAAYGAYQTYLIDRGTGADSNRAVSYVPYTDGIRQTKRVSESGGMNEYLISIGANYQEKLMLGASLGIVSLRYERTLRFNEEDISGRLDNEFKYMQFTERLNTTGTGINLKLGAIYRPNQQVRFGFALHTPTHIELNDVSSIGIVSHTDSLLLYNNIGASPITEYQQDSALVFNYSMSTPYKALASAMFLFGKSGFITADIDYVNYASMRYQFDGFEGAASAMNDVIRSTYRGTVNARVGAEARYNLIGFRAGFAYYGSPYANSSLNASRKVVSGGIGFRQQFWFIDGAYMYQWQNQQEVPYILTRADAQVQAAQIDARRGTFVLSLGLRF